jgi:hypothetical protein
MRYVDPGAIRWEAWPHQRIYDATHTEAAGSAYSLATTVPLWREIVADLGEVRTRYEAAVRRLLEANAGTNADAADATSQLVTRGLAEARELATLAGAKRARLSELNDQLRREMPEPGVPVEDGSQFLDRGLGWLTPPEFHALETNRLNTEDRARDLMRNYEASISPEALAADAHNSLTGSPAMEFADHTGGEPTVPLPATLAGGAPTHTNAEPRGQDAGQFTGELGMFTRAPVPSGYFWSYADFGPEGVAEPEDSDGEEPARAAAGPVPALRYDSDEFVGRHLVSDDLFMPHIKLPPPVIGE